VPRFAFTRLYAPHAQRFGTQNGFALSRSGVKIYDWGDGVVSLRPELFLAI
jgi:hypothetical protein